MTDTTSLDVFYSVNNTDLTKFIGSKLYSQDQVQDTVQNFYLYCGIHDALSKWDCSRSSYSTYICHLAQWRFPKREPITCEVTEDMPDQGSTSLPERVISFQQFLRNNGGEHVEALLKHLVNRIQGKTLADEPYVRIKYLRLLSKFRLMERAGI